MRIDGIFISGNSCGATIFWETSNREPDAISFQFEPSGIDCTPEGTADAFFAACSVLAIWRGEERIWMPLPVCPLLYRNLTESLAYLNHWFYADDGSKSLGIEVEIRKDILRRPTSRNAAVFFSGGIDSMFTLRSNLDLYPADHALRITKGIVVKGFEVHDIEAFGIAKSHLQLAAASAGIELLFVHTNLYSAFRSQDQHLGFLIQQFEGAFFAAIAHTLSQSVERVALGTTLDLKHLVPNGTHPLLRYSSALLDFTVDGTSFDRLRKAQSLVGWEPAMRFLRVCNKTDRYAKEGINCGKCNKCVGAMLLFFSLGVLDKMETLHATELTPDVVAEFLTPRVPFQQTLCRQLAERFHRSGETSLADAVESVLFEYRS